ncbi:iron ABC transporter permease [Leucobacter sp. OH1287]|uniref:FecCD family ABC transporter permease n=1 Tax=Leucobacter sp. OH1287 TaxID=2491049 RepID=UPI000F5E18D6|nr:iron chelate uptake ABC transporter family permease subunit [Leucobacter sp. OH1287]RRD61181.1 iron ABC transporter permease [Leucobacter sp. OH1287]
MRLKSSVLLIALLLLTVTAALSIAIGSNQIPLLRTVELLFVPDSSFESTVVHEQRIPRTLLVIAVAAALGVAGAVIQSLTRNPLADPGILGVNAGASLAVVLAVAVFGIASIWFYLWFAFIGAALAAVVVYLLGSAGGSAATPVRLALAGVAIGMAIFSLVQTVLLTNQQAFNEFRFWAAGSAEGRGYPVLFAVIGFIVAGLILAFAIAPALNAMALGDEAGKALGVNVTRTRVITMIAVTLLAGAATAAVGPISFIGLGVPYVARALCGSDQRWVLPAAALLAPTMLLGADIIGRVVATPSEVQAGIVAAIIGGPVFVVIARKKRIESL